jgi:hypothetical protein
MPRGGIERHRTIVLEGYDCGVVNLRTFILNHARTRRKPSAVLLLFLFALLAVIPCRADDAATKAAGELAQKLASQLDRNQKVALEVTDLTGEMRRADMDATQRLIETELHAHGFQIVNDASFEIKIRITLSQDSVERLWVADFTREGKQSALMVPFELITPDLRSWATGMHLDRELVFSQNSPMLDFGCDSSAAAKDCGDKLILNADSVVLMSTELNFPSANILHEKPWPRDLRGRLTRNGPVFEVNIGDVTCQGEISHIAEAMKCGPQRNRQWIFSGPLGGQSSAQIASEQNWFEWTGAVGPNPAQPKRPPFYSMAGFEVNGQSAWIATGVDGNARVFTEKSGDPIGSIPGWGSEIATVKSECGTGWQILATKARDYTENDSITVYEWAGNELRADSGPIEMNGPIVAMWSDQSGGPARAVVRNLKTGDYEAYLLKVGCSQ